MYFEQMCLLNKAFRSFLKLCRYYWRGFNVVVALPCQSVQMWRSRHWRRADLRLQSIIVRHKWIIQPGNTKWEEYEDSESVVWTRLIFALKTWLGLLDTSPKSIGFLHYLHLPSWCDSHWNTTNQILILLSTKPPKTTQNLYVKP